MAIIFTFSGVAGSLKLKTSGVIGEPSLIALILLSVFVGFSISFYHKIETFDVKLLVLKLLSDKKRSELKQPPSNQKKSQGNGGKLDRVTLSILEKIFHEEDNAPIAIIASTMKIDLKTFQYHLDILFQEELIDTGPEHLGEPTTYVVNENGRKYVVERILKETK